METQSPGHTVKPGKTRKLRAKSRKSARSVRPNRTIVDKVPASSASPAVPDTAIAAAAAATVDDVDKKAAAPGHSSDPASASSGTRLPALSPVYLAILVALAIAGWFLSGTIIIGGQSDSSQSDSGQSDRKTAVQPQSAPATGPSQALTGNRQRANGPATALPVAPADKTAPFQVVVLESEARLRQRLLELRGRTEADARVELRAQTSGVVEALPVVKGRKVTKGTVICRLETGARKAEVMQAEAALAQAKLRYQASQRLNRKGHVSRVKLLTDLAALNVARANLVKARLDLDRTRIRAPFTGIIETLPARPGTLLLANGFGTQGVCASLVRLDPLLLVAFVSEADIAGLKPGIPVTASLATGETVSGRLHFISPSADARTRTFRIEVAVANPGNRYRDGVTALIKLPVNRQKGHLVSAAALVLNDDGQLGVRIVNERGRAEFKPVERLAETDKGVWIGGLPDHVRIIVQGQNYVSDHQPVKIGRALKPVS